MSARTTADAPDDRTRAALRADGTTWVTGIQLTRLPDGQQVHFSAALAPSMYLQEAQHLGQRGETLRAEVLASVQKNEHGLWRVTDRTVEFDAIATLAASVILAYTAIEAYANELVVHPDEEAIISYERHAKAKTVSQSKAIDTGGWASASRWAWE